jgi:tRNA dimethylallyltransferase
MPKADPAVRAALADEAAAQGWPALHAELARVDPATAARLAPNDSQRISRALEVFRVSGQPLSFFHAPRRAKNSARQPCGQALISLEPQDRSWLHERIALRFDAMLAAGFIDEVQGPARARRPRPRPALHALRRLPPGLGGAGRRLPDGELRDKGIFATRQLAKRQITWLRSMPSARWWPAMRPMLCAGAGGSQHATGARPA